MLHRLFESISGESHECIINPNKYNHNKFIDIDVNNKYIVYNGIKMSINFVTSQQSEFLTSGFVPQFKKKKLDHYKTYKKYNIDVYFVYILNFNKFDLYYVGIKGKKYKLPNQSDLD